MRFNRVKADSRTLTGAAYIEGKTMIIKKNIQYVDEIMTDAFMIWLSKIGYHGIKKSGEIIFYCKVVNKKFPRNVVVMANGQLNRAASQLFEEFKAHVAA